MTVTYIPVLAGVSAKNVDRWGKTLTWWRESDYFYYPHILLSYGSHHRINVDALKFPKQMEILTDSGGFEIASQGADIDPIESLRWQEKNGNVGFILDHPPIKFAQSEGGAEGEKGRFQKIAIANPAIWKASLENSMTNAQIMQDRRLRSDFKLYGVLHGKDFKQTAEWMKRLVKVGKWDGMAMSPKPCTSVSSVLKHLITFQEFNEDGNIPVHLFQTTGFRIFPILVLWSARTGHRVSCDSITYAGGSMYRRYVIPGLEITEIYIGKESKNPLELPCNCPVCRMWSVDDLVEYNYSGQLLSLHNLYWFKDCLSRLTALSSNEEKFLDYARVFEPNIDHAFHILNDYQERGYDYVVERENMMEGRTSVNYDKKQQTLVGFGGEKKCREESCLEFLTEGVR